MAFDPQSAAANAVKKAANYPSKNAKKPAKGGPPGNFHPNNPVQGMHPLKPHKGKKGKHHLPNLTPGQIKNAAKARLARGGASWARSKMEGKYGPGLSMPPAGKKISKY